MKLGIDVDEVVASLHAPWLAWGNEKFGTAYTEFARWDSPTDYWGADAGQFLHPRIYEPGGGVVPLPGTLEAIEHLRALGHDILYVTSCPYRTERAKWDWLERHGFAGQREEMLAMTDKSQAPVDVLVDDGFHNCSLFQGEASVLVTRSHNRDEDFDYRIGHLCELPAILRHLQTLRCEERRPK